MTTIHTNVDVTAAGSRAASLVSVIADWITTADHKKIGRLFIGSSLVAAVATAVLAAFLGLERMSASSYSILNGDSIVQLFAAYQFSLVYAIVAPLFIGLAIAVVPMQ